MSDNYSNLADIVNAIPEAEVIDHHRSQSEQDELFAAHRASFERAPAFSRQTSLNYGDVLSRQTSIIIGDKYLWNNEMDNEEDSIFSKYLLWIGNNKVFDQMQKIYKETNNVTQIRAFVALYSSIMLWVGAWDIVTDLFNHIPNEFIDFSSYSVQFLLCIPLGTFIMLYVGVLYQVQFSKARPSNSHH